MPLAAARFTAERAAEIWQRHVVGGTPVAEWVIKTFGEGGEAGSEGPFLAKQRLDALNLPKK